MPRTQEVGGELGIIMFVNQHLITFLNRKPCSACNSVYLVVCSWRTCIVLRQIQKAPASRSCRPLSCCGWIVWGFTSSSRCSSDKSSESLHCPQPFQTLLNKLPKQAAMSREFGSGEYSKHRANLMVCVTSPGSWEEEGASCPFSVEEAVIFLS